MKIIFVSMDTLRADRLTSLGYDRGTTPNLDRIASEGALFEKVYASDIPTQPSHTAMFTGRFGINSGIVSHFHPPASLPQQVDWLPEMAANAGWATGAVDHLFVMKDWFSRGYSDYMVPPGRSRSPAEDINRYAFPWLEDHKQEDFFLFIHYWDPHIPYLPPRDYIERFAQESSTYRDPATWEVLASRPTFPVFKRTHYQHLDDIPNVPYLADLYDAEIAYLDHHIGCLIAKLDTLGILDETMIVLAGDHGEIMTEHDAWYDHAGLYESVVHVPLIIRYPKTIAPVRVPAMVQLVDVMPTICETAGFNLPSRLDGRSLYPLIRGEGAQGRSEVWLSEATWQAKRGLRTERWKYMRCYDPGVYGRMGPELYDLWRDPDEQENVAASRPDVVADLDGRLRHWVDEQLDGAADPMREVIEFGLPAIERLRGYIEEDRASVEETASLKRINLASANGQVIDLSDLPRQREVEPLAEVTRP